MISGDSDSIEPSDTAQPSNAETPDPSAARPNATSDEPATMSVDQLTQALANLMQDQGGAADHAARSPIGRERIPSPTTDSTASAAGRRGEDHPVESESVDASKDGNVTPASIVEALLFVGHPQNQPLTNRQVASYLRGVSPQEVDALIEQLNVQYAEQSAPYRIVSVGAGYRMELHPAFAWLSDRFYGRVREAKLSQAAVDLLAIVAYHQPISRDEIDRLRGQSSGATLAQLVRRQLLQVAHTPDRPRKKVYRTTDRFLDLFGLESLEDLPSHEDF
jgi:segregation and condensation protein B